MKHTIQIILFISLLLCLHAYGNKPDPLPSMVTDSLKDVSTDSILVLQDISKQYHKMILENENKRKKTYIIGIVVVSTLILIHSYAYLEYLRQQNIQNRVQLDNIKAIKEEIYRKSSEFIEENKKKIEEVEQKLQNANHTNTALKIQLERQKQIILCTNRQIEMELDEQAQAETDFLNSDVYIRFKEEINVKKSDADWQALQEAVDKTYKNFTGNLRKFHNFSSFELRICLLIKINIHPSDMAKLTNHTKESITATRRRLYEKVFLEKGNPKLWDDFIHAL